MKINLDKELKRMFNLIMGLLIVIRIVGFVDLSWSSLGLMFMVLLVIQMLMVGLKTVESIIATDR
jgi:hypothetical protein